MTDETIQIEDKFYQKAKVILLPSNDFIYIVSEDEVKTGDWYVYPELDKATKNGITFIYKIAQAGKDFGKFGLAGKIIATTDESLTITDFIGENVIVATGGNLPKPPDDFIKNEKGIDEILVEVQRLFSPDNKHWALEVNKTWENVISRTALKIAPDNTITIKPISLLKPKTYTKDEIISLYDQYEGYIISLAEKNRVGLGFKMWIKQY